MDNATGSRSEGDISGFVESAHCEAITVVLGMELVVIEGAECVRSVVTVPGGGDGDIFCFFVHRFGEAIDERFR